MGLDIGLDQAGFETRVAVEIDKSARETIRTNTKRLNQQVHIFGDVTALNAEKIIEIANISRGQVTLVSGGPPCQPFSTAGKRGALNDPRGSLFRDFLRLVDGLQPRFFVMENVRGLLSAPILHRSYADRKSYPTAEEMPGSAFSVILEEFSKIGYSFEYGLLNAADYGVAQTRERVVILGSRDHERISLPQATHSANGISLPPWRTLHNAIGDLNEAQPVFQAYSDSRLQYLKLVPEGGNWRSLPNELQSEAMGGAYNSGGGKVGFYRRLSWNKPSPTVTTSPAQKATDMCHPTELRPISVREAARIQGFPDDWIFCGSISDQYRQIGIAVPVGLGFAIGQSIVKAMKGQTIFQRAEQQSLFSLV